MRLLSYCLFQSPPVRKRAWDRWRRQEDRYWYNLPAIFVANQMLLPGYAMRIYVSEDIRKHRLADLLPILEKHGVQVHDCPTRLSGFNHTLSRYAPFWEEFQFVYPRDLDSLTRSEDVNFIRYFEASGMAVGTIRSHPAHSVSACIMLGGLSCFNLHTLKAILDSNDFETWSSGRKSEFSTDQNALIDTFTQDTTFTQKSFLDFALNKKPPLIPCCSVTQVPPASWSDTQLAVQQLLDESSAWLGEPRDSRGTVTQKLLTTYSPELFDQLCRNDRLSKFYKLK